jgi:hypothetical protein
LPVPAGPGQACVVRSPWRGAVAEVVGTTHLAQLRPRFETVRRQQTSGRGAVTPAVGSAGFGCSVGAGKREDSRVGAMAGRIEKIRARRGTAVQILVCDGAPGNWCSG